MYHKPEAANLKRGVGRKLIKLPDREYCIAVNLLKPTGIETLEDMGKRFGITREYVRQIEDKLRLSIPSIPGRNSISAAGEREYQQRLDRYEAEIVSVLKVEQQRVPELANRVAALTGVPKDRIRAYLRRLKRRHGISWCPLKTVTHEQYLAIEANMNSANPKGLVEIGREIGIRCGANLSGRVRAMEIRICRLAKRKMRPRMHRLTTQTDRRKIRANMNRDNRKSIKEMAAEIGITPGAICQWERKIRGGRRV